MASHSGRWLLELLTNIIEEGVPQGLGGRDSLRELVLEDPLEEVDELVEVGMAVVWHEVGLE